MIEDIANKISIYCVKLQPDRVDDKEIIAFGLFHILSSLLQIALLITVGLVFDILLEITAYTVGFTSLKRYIGGAHAHKHWICLWGFTFLSSTCCFVCLLLPPYICTYAAVLAAFIMLLFVLMKAPVPHPNNPKSMEKLKKFRKISISIALLQFIIIILGCLLLADQLGLFILCGAMGGLSATLTLILPMPS